MRLSPTVGHSVHVLLHGCRLSTSPLQKDVCRFGRCSEYRKQVEHQFPFSWSQNRARLPLCSSWTVGNYCKAELLRHAIKGLVRSRKPLFDAFRRYTRCQIRSQNMFSLFQGMASIDQVSRYSQPLLLLLRLCVFSIPDSNMS